MNICMAIAFVLLAGYIILVRMHPDKMRYWADWLNARADAEDYHKQRVQDYLKLRKEKDELLELERLDGVTK